MIGGFDVYNIETAMPKIDLDAIESHLRAAREEERRVSKTDFSLSQLLYCQIFILSPDHKKWFLYKTIILYKIPNKFF